MSNSLGTVTLGQLAELVKGTVLGDPNLPIQAAVPLDEAGSATGAITFLDSEKKVAQFLKSTFAAAVAPLNTDTKGKPAILVADPMGAFVIIFKKLHGRRAATTSGIDPRAYVHPTAQIGDDVSILPFAFIGEGAVIGPRCIIHNGASVGRFCTLAEDVVLHPNVVLYEGTSIGARSIVHAGTILGADGFGYRFKEGKHEKVPQLGTVEIGPDVEIGACTTIDRGAFQATRIGQGTKIDNLVQVGHNCQVGNHNLFVSQMGMAGSCTTGNYVIIAGQVGIADHLHIGDGAILGPQTGVARDVDAGARMFGTPAMPEWDTKRVYLTLDKLPDMRKDLRKVMKHLGLDEEKEPKRHAG